MLTTVKQTSFVSVVEQTFYRQLLVYACDVIVMTGPCTQYAEKLEGCICDIPNTKDKCIGTDL